MKMKTLSMTNIKLMLTRSKVAVLQGPLSSDEQIHCIGIEPDNFISVSEDIGES